MKFLTVVTCIFTLVQLSSTEVTLMRRTMPEVNVTYSAAEWKKIIEALRPKVDFAGVTPLNQPISSGKLNQKLAGQIIGGSTAVRGQFPWQAVIIINDAYLCGGSLILADWILTAAHCAADGSKFSVTLGSVDRGSNSANSITQLTTQKFVHANYSDATLSYDVALLKLNTPVTFNMYINSVKLPSLFDGSTTFEGVLATVSGFGKTSDYESASRYLNHVQVGVISNAQCAQVYGPTIVLASNLCTRQPNQATCQGDSGGPLVFKDRTDTWVQIGVVSFGSSKGCLIGPSGFSRVTSFLGWISNQVGQDVSASTNVWIDESPKTTQAPTTTTSTLPSTTKPLKCSVTNFATLRKTCCLETPVLDLIPYDRNDKSCPNKVSIASLKVFNTYFLNKQQNPKLNHAVQFNDSKVQKNLLKDSCFVECYLIGRGLVKNGAVDKEGLKSLLSTKHSGFWQRAIQTSVDECYSENNPSGAKLAFSDGKTSCDGRLLILIQCVQQKLTSKCPLVSPSMKCGDDYSLFKMCSALMSSSLRA